MRRPWFPVLPLLCLLQLVVACGSNQGMADRPPVNGAAEVLARKREMEQRLRNEQELCQRERPDRQARMAALRRAESRLAAVKQESYRPLPPPAPWDEATEARFRPEDREVDWQRHLQDQAIWQRREEARRAGWRADHQVRLQAAQAELDRQARDLRERLPQIFTGPGSIEFNPVVVARIEQCRG